jgi:hypothetical protein
MNLTAPFCPDGKISPAHVEARPHSPTETASRRPGSARLADPADLGFHLVTLDDLNQLRSGIAMDDIGIVVASVPAGADATKHKIVRNVILRV